MPSVDLIDMFLRLAQKYGMKFWFGLYDSGKYWDTGDLSQEIEDNKYVIDEVWKMYGEKYTSLPTLSTSQGSPPRARGEAMVLPFPVNRVRITPACAGRSGYQD